MITTTKQEIRKAVIEALEEWILKKIEPSLIGKWFMGNLKNLDLDSVADLVAETLGEPQKPQKPQWTLESPCHWAESVKMADEMPNSGLFIVALAYQDGDYFINDFRPKINGEPVVTYGPFSLPELHDKLKELTND